MTTVITGKLNKDANEFQAGESIGFGIRLGVQYYDRKTKGKEWTNYSAAVFAKAGPQAEFYRSALTEGAIVELSGASEKIDSYDGANGVLLTIELNDAKLGYIGFAGDPKPKAVNAHSPAPAADGFDDEIDF
jgi:single-strand DNA-binding protein